MTTPYRTPGDVPKEEENEPAVRVVRGGWWQRLWHDEFIVQERIDGRWITRGGGADRLRAVEQGRGLAALRRKHPLRNGVVWTDADDPQGERE